MICGTVFVIMSLLDNTESCHLCDALPSPTPHLILLILEGHKPGSPWVRASVPIALAVMPSGRSQQHILLGLCPRVLQEMYDLPTDVTGGQRGVGVPVQPLSEKSTFCAKWYQMSPAGQQNVPVRYVLALNHSRHRLYH